MGDNRAILLGVLIDDRAHQLAARRAAAGGHHALGGVTLGDQPAPCIDEIVEGVGPLEQLALQIPAPPEIVAAADVGDGIGKAAVHKAEARGRKARRHGIAIGAVSIEMQRPRPLDPGLPEQFRTVFPHHDADRHHRPVARLNGHTLGGVEAGIIAARDFLRLQRLQLGRRDIIIIDRARRDHRLIGKPQLLHVVFGVVGKARSIARLGEADRGHAARIVVVTQRDLIEPVLAALDHEEVLEQVESGQIEFVRTGNHRLPIPRRFQLRLGQAEVDVVIVGPHPDLAVAHVDRIFHALLPRLHQDRLGGRIGGGDKAHFARLVVAGGDDQPVFLRGQPGADAEGLVFLLVERDVAFNRCADHVQLGFERAPFLGRRAVDQCRIVRDPHQIAAQVFEHVGQQLAGLQVLDPCGVAFRAVGVGRIGQITPVLADRSRAEAEIFEALGQLVLVDQQLVRPARRRLAPVLAILRAFLELGPVDVVAVLLGHRAVVLLDTRAHLGEQGFGEGCLRRHLGFEIGVLRLDVVQHVLVVDGGIGLVVEPVIRVFDGDPVAGVAVRALFRDGGLDFCGGRGGGRRGHAGRILSGGGHRGRSKGGGCQRGGKGKAADRTGHFRSSPMAGRRRASGWKDARARPMMAVLVTHSRAASA